MNKHFISGFIKRASQYGVSKNKALTILTKVAQDEGLQTMPSQANRDFNTAVTMGQQFFTDPYKTESSLLDMAAQFGAPDHASFSNQVEGFQDQMGSSWDLTKTPIAKNFLSDAYNQYRPAIKPMFGPEVARFADRTNTYAQDLADTIDAMPKTFSPAQVAQSLGEDGAADAWEEMHDMDAETYRNMMKEIRGTYPAKTLKTPDGTFEIPAVTYYGNLNRLPIFSGPGPIIGELQSKR